MKRLLVLFVFLFATSSNSFATHIVGGEISIEYLSGTTYRLTLSIYRDMTGVNTWPFYPLTIVRKSDNVIMDEIEAPRISFSRVEYTDPACATVVNAQETEKHIYQVDITLDSDTYDDDGGYYVSVQTCCRNGTVANIIFPSTAGQTFYMEFPKESLKNSSPILLPPLSDYACVNQPFTIDLAVTDPDGDDLVYRLVAPLNVTPRSANSAPFDPVTFAAGFTVSNMIPGAPPLFIDTDGILTVNPNQVGLFVFAVAIDEYRGGVKIGQITREFQLQTLDCPEVDAPVMELTTNGSTYNEGDTLTFDYFDTDKCTDIEINDEQADSEGTIIIKPRNWDGSGITFSNPDWEGSNDFVEICFPDCPLGDGEPYIFDVIVSDNSCAIPLRDTTRMQVLIDYPNSEPELSTPLTFNTGTKIYETEVFVDNLLSFNVLANDADNDEIEIFEIIGVGFTPTTLGMTFSAKAQANAPLSSTFSWTPDCDALPINKDSMIYRVQFRMRDYKECIEFKTDTITVDILVKLPLPNPTLISSTLNHDIVNDIWFDTLDLHDLVAFSVAASDIDNEKMEMELQGKGFDIATLGMTFPLNSGTGAVASNFEWNTFCNPEMLTPTEITAYEFELFVRTFNSCGAVNAIDTVDIRLVIRPEEENTNPITSSTLTYDPVEDFYWDTLTVNDLVNFEINVTDADHDSLTFVFEGLDEKDGVPYDFQTDLGATFTQTSGAGFFDNEFNWQTDCNTLAINTATMEADTTAYFFRAYLADYGTCDTAVYKDTIDVRIVLIPILNNPPVLTSTLNFDVVEGIFYDSLEINNLENFTLFLDDTDGDSVQISMGIDDFVMEDLGATFPERKGKASTSSEFNWDLLCQHLIPIEGADTTSYEFKVFTADYDTCGNFKSVDTTRVRLTLLPRTDNVKPTHSSSLVYDNPNDIYLDSVIVTQTTNFTFDINDANGDSITVEFEGQGINRNTLGMTFTPNSGTGVINATFDWQTECKHLVNETETLYKINGIIKEYNLCGNIKSTDTTEFHILVLPPVASSNALVTSDSLAYDAVNEIFFDTLTVLEALRFDFNGEDLDGDVITLSLDGDGFTLASIGASFDMSTNTDNSINGDFNWQTNCNSLQPLTDTTDYIFNAIIQDFDICGGQNPNDTTKIRITVLPIINLAPIIDTLGVSDLLYDALRDIYTVEINFGDTLEFDMMGDDVDGDIITLSGKGLGFTLSDLDMEFQPIRDLPRVDSHFKWIAGCNIYGKVDYTQPYIVEFQVADEGNCAADSSKIQRVEIILKEVPNDIPVIYIEEVPINATSNCYEMRVVAGDTLKFDVFSTDLNQDDVTILGSVVNFDFSHLGMQFSSVTGKPASLPLSSEFVWATNFRILEDYQDSLTYELNFTADDRSCELVNMCVKITLINCQTPDLVGIPALTNLCTVGDTLGREIPANEDWAYWWSSDVGIEGDSTQRLIYTKKTGIYTIHVEYLADHCVYESRAIVRVADLFLEPKDTTICAAQAPAHLIARDLAHGSNFIFEWRNLLDTSIIVQSDTTGLLKVDSSGVYLVKMTNPNGACFLIDTVEAVINPNPSFEITGYTNAVCKDPVNLQIENTNLTGFKVKWSVQAQDTIGYFEGSTNNLHVTLLKSGYYTATLTDTATNCDTSKSIEIIINNNPTINLDSSLKDTVICQNTDFVVNAFNASHPFEAIYQWTNLATNAVVSDSSKLVIAFGDFDKTGYEITVKAPNSSCQSKDTIRVGFVRQTVAKITGTKTGICLGEEISLQASGGDNFSWNNGDTTESLTLIPEVLGIYTYILEAKYQNSCASSFDTIQIAVTTVPYVNIETTLGICQEDTTAFLDAAHSTHPFNANYKWYRLGDTTSISDSSRIELKIDNFINRGFDVFSPFDLLVKVSNSQNGCPATDTVRVEFGKVAIAEIDSTFKSEICLGESITLRATGGDTLYWNTGDSTAVVHITPDKIGYHRFIAFARNPLTCPVTSDTIFVKINPLPMIDLFPVDSIVICYGDTLQFTPSGGESGKYLWEHLPNPADTIFVLPKVNTTYYVFGTDVNGCQSSDSVKVMLRPTIDLPKEMQACEGETLEIGAESPIEANYYWLNSGFTTPTIRVRTSGTYSVRITTAECIYTRSVEVKFAEYPKLESTKDTTFCFEFDEENNFAEGKTHVIKTQITNFDSTANYAYVWLDTAGFILGQVDSLEIGEEGIYAVQVFDKKLKNTCPSTDTVRIKALCEPRIFIPTAFSPNGDEFNDRFTIFGKHIQNFKMEVYDRWGVLIYILDRANFEDIKADEFWDGTTKGQPLPNGSYVWTIQYANSLSEKTETVNLNGQINIVR